MQVQPPGSIQNFPQPDGSIIVVTWGPSGSYTQSITPAPNSPLANQQTIVSNLQSALPANAAYLGILNPTPAQVASQTTALTSQVNGLIRYVLTLFDATI